MTGRKRGGKGEMVAERACVEYGVLVKAGGRKLQ